MFGSLKSRNKTLELIKEGIKIFKNGKKVD